LLVADPIEGQGSAGEGVADFDRGLGLVKKGAWADAIGYFDKALAAAPKRAEAEYYRALAKEHVGDHAGAEQGYSRALELDPKLVEASINLGALCLDTDGGKLKPKTRKAVAVLTAALDQAAEEDKADIRLNLAHAFGLDKSYAKAIDQYEALLGKHNEPRLHYAYGVMLAEADRCGAAVEQLQQALPGFGDNSAILAKIADGFGRCKAYDACVKTLDAAVSLEPSKPDWYVRRGVCEHGAGHDPKAQADFEKAVETDATFAPGYYYLGMSLRADHTKATAALQKAVKLDREGPIGKKAQRALDKMASGPHGPAGGP